MRALRRWIIISNWPGFDEMDEVRGDGSPELDDSGSLEIEIRFHLGDEAIVKARKWRLFQQAANEF